MHETDFQAWEARRVETEHGIGTLGQDALQKLFGVRSGASVLECPEVAPALELRQRISLATSTYTLNRPTPSWLVGARPQSPKLWKTRSPANGPDSA